MYHGTADETHYDAEQRPILQVKDRLAAKSKTRLLYNVAGHLAETLDSKGRLVEALTTDLLGRVLFRVGMDTGAAFSFFDCMNRPVLAVDTRNWRRLTTYDCIGRETELLLSQDGGTEILAQSIRYGDKLEDAERLNLRGEVVTICDQSGVRENKRFDFKGNCLAHSIQFAADYKGIIDWNKDPGLESAVHARCETFDALDRLVLSENGDGGLTRRYYGISGQLQKVAWKRSDGPEGTDWVDYMSNVIYEADGRTKQILYGNGVLATLEYDVLSRALSRKKLVRRADQRVLEDTSYSYDIMLRVIRSNDAAQSTLYFNNTVVDATSSYTYDYIGRLVAAEGRENADADGTGKGSFGIPNAKARICRYREEYTYDEADNIRQVTHHAGPKGQHWTREYEYEEKSLARENEGSNRLSYTTQRGETEHWSYGDEDKVGSAGQGQVTAIGGMHSMAWDPFNHLKSCSRQVKKKGVPETTWYVYNRDGKRVRKLTERAASESEVPRKLKDTLYLAGLHIYTCKDDRSNYHKARRYHLVHGVDQKVVGIAEEDMTKPEENHLLFRYQASDKLELDDSGLIVHYEEYHPFGSSAFALRRSQREAARKYRFASYERDKETGLYYCNARYYAPWLARWISTDPVGTMDGLNLFCYCGNDPVNYTDPAGTMKKKPENSLKTSPYNQNLLRNLAFTDGQQPQIIPQMQNVVQGQVIIPPDQIPYTPPIITLNMKDRSRETPRTGQQLGEGTKILGKLQYNNTRIREQLNDAMNGFDEPKNGQLKAHFRDTPNIKLFSDNQKEDHMRDRNKEIRSGVNELQGLRDEINRVITNNESTKFPNSTNDDFLRPLSGFCLEDLQKASDIAGESLGMLTDGNTLDLLDDTRMQISSNKYEQLYKLDKW
ncbi:tRNA(Glu)-specific nuclease WapA [Colletotrichum liriopes]|uniref:tRNA(Glu)-specific nuclease WapA n=1 Tax=Colletotrichum liriopes TaxID=708192 RepID=A0AA37H1T6_9PEZI|nr:tRNA(Glu)-specific nuclease WapA [Colletotrichum liriopes]